MPQTGLFFYIITTLWYVLPVAHKSLSLWVPSQHCSSWHDSWILEDPPFGSLGRRFPVGPTAHGSQQAINTLFYTLLLHSGPLGHKKVNIIISTTLHWVCLICSFLPVLRLWVQYASTPVSLWYSNPASSFPHCGMGKWLCWASVPHL